MHNLTAIALHDAFCQGTHTASEIVEHFLARIAARNDELGAFLAVFDERARAKAKELDERRARGGQLGKLAGVPIAIKDNINIRGELTTCASHFLTNFTAPFDATVIQLLEAEDAIILGKTNMDEFAMGSTTEHSALATTRNPWDLKCTAGGSSGGSCVAVAARLAPLALGSDTGGSVRQPAALTGITGFKPTYGRVSRYGLVAFGSSLDQISPFAKTPADIGMLMEVIGAPCDHDATSLPKPPEVYGLASKVDGLKVGIPYGCLKDLAPEVRANLDAALDQLKSMGAELVEVELDMIKYSIAVYYILATAEASTNLARFDGIRYGQRSKRAKTLAEVYDMSKAEGFGNEVKRRIMLGTYVLSSGFQDAYYKKAQRVRTLFVREFEEAFKKCDIVALPTSPRAAWELGSISDPLQEYLADLYTICANLAGIPGISVPSGFTEEGKPLGLQLLGPQQADVHLCQVAQAYADATRYAERAPNE